MKRNFLVKSGFCMLVAVGTLTPLTSVANEQGKMGSVAITHLQSETPTVYGNPDEGFARTERGALGPKGSSRMEGPASSEHLYSEAPTQYGDITWGESKKMGQGAQGPIRNESMDASGSHLFSDTPTEYGK